MVRNSFFIATIWASSAFPFFSGASSPRSPSGRKTKSPGLFDLLPFEDCPDLPSPRSSPRFKRTRSVRINDNVFYQPDDWEYWLERGEPEINEDIDIDEDYGIMRPVASRTKYEYSSPQSVVDKLSAPATPETSSASALTTAGGASLKLAPIQSEATKVLEPPRSILKIRLFNKAHPNQMELFKYGRIRDLENYYKTGVQLSLPEVVLTEIFNHLVDNRHFGKLKVIYEHDRLKFNELVLKNEELTIEAILNLAFHVFKKRAEQDLMILQESDRLYSTTELRVAFYLLSSSFDPQEVYNVVTSLLEADEESLNHVLIKEIIDQYNRKPGTVPLLIFAVQKGLEFRTIFEFEPNEVDRLDSENCSIIYYATCEGNLDVLEFFNSQAEIGRKLAGLTPLIGAAKNNRDDSLEFFLEKSNRVFDQKDYEDAAFSAAIFNNFKIFKMLFTAEKIDLYCFRGDSTFLSVALKNGNLGFAKSLLERLNFNINFVGEDPINPEGHALVYVLDKYSFVEMFLKLGASRNIKVYINQEDERSEGLLVPLDEYLRIKMDARLIKLFEKYSSV